MIDRVIYFDDYDYEDELFYEAIEAWDDKGEQVPYSENHEEGKEDEHSS